MAQELFVYGPIGRGFDPFTGEPANSARDVINSLPKSGDVNLRVNSDGGDVFEARAMVEALRQHQGTVTATVDAIAASAASFLLAGADEVLMAPGAMLMIHSPWTIEAGNAEAFDKTAALLRQVENEVILPAYAEMGVSIPQNRLKTMLAEETWIGAADAIEMGFAAGYSRKSEEPIAALIRPGIWQHVPDGLVAAPAALATKAKLDIKATQIVHGYNKLALARLKNRIETGKIRRDADLLKSRT